MEDFDFLVDFLFVSRKLRRDQRQHYNLVFFYMLVKNKIKLTE